MKFHVDIGNEVWADVIVPDEDLEEIAEVLCVKLLDLSGIAPSIKTQYIKYIDVVENPTGYMVGFDIKFLNNVLKILFPTCLQDFHLLDNDGNVYGNFIEAISTTLSMNTQFALACEHMIIDDPEEDDEPSRLITEDIIKKLQQQNL